MSMMKRYFEYCMCQDPELKKAVFDNDQATVEKILEKIESTHKYLEGFLEAKKIIKFKNERASVRNNRGSLFYILRS